MATSNYPSEANAGKVSKEMVITEAGSTVPLKLPKHPYATATPIRTQKRPTNTAHVRDVTIGDIRAVLAKATSPEMRQLLDDGYTNRRDASLDSLVPPPPLGARRSVESQTTTVVSGSVRGSYIDAATITSVTRSVSRQPHYNLTRMANPSTSTLKPVIRRRKSSGAPLFCGLSKKKQMVANFSDSVELDSEDLFGGTVEVAVSVVQEEWKSAADASETARRKSRFSIGVSSRKRSGSDAVKMGVAM